MWISLQRAPTTNSSASERPRASTAHVLPDLRNWRRTTGSAKRYWARCLPWL
jgi:hypothetical protein